MLNFEIKCINDYKVIINYVKRCFVENGILFVISEEERSCFPICNIIEYRLRTIKEDNVEEED